MPRTNPDSATISPTPAPAEAIRVRGARVHNLKNVGVDIPHNKLVVLAGVSGSGKSSLAYDTLFAEGQRRFLESISTYTRQFLQQLERPDVDSIDGLPPVISIDQQAGSVRPRSTLATTTQIYDYLRLLYARAGQAHCPDCGLAVSRQSSQQIVQRILELEDRRKVMILAPLVRGRKGEHRQVFERICAEGFVRARLDGEVIDAADPPKLAKGKTHDVEAVVDRIVVKEGIRPRLQESVELALSHGEGMCIVSFQEGKEWHDRLYSERLACIGCGESYHNLEPRSFSFNSPYGACPACEGLGVTSEERESLESPATPSTVRRPRTSSEQAAPLPPGEGQPQSPRALRQGEGPIAGEHSPVVPRSPFVVSRSPDRDTPTTAGLSRGGRPAVEHVRGRETRAQPEETRAQPPSPNRDTCPECRGARLNRFARSVTFGGSALHELTALSIESIERLLRELEQGRDKLDLTPEGRAAAERTLPEIASRLGFLKKVGLDYLSLDRPTRTLSGGEYQRARLGAGLGSSLAGVCYILDEPTVGLHARDAERLIAALVELRDQGASLIVVEHDEQMMRRADWLIDVGPGAGREGGEVVACGTPAEVARGSDSPTARLLRGESNSHRKAAARPIDLENSLTLRGARLHNLKNVDVTIPLGALVCVTGVSGSGKSSLFLQTLVPALKRMKQKLGFSEQPDASQFPGNFHSKADADFSEKPGFFPDSLEGVERIARVVEIDQQPIGRSGRSNAATYTGLWNEVRKLFARTRDARLRGYKVRRFSFNAKEGRCQECRGAGSRRIQMQFLPDLYVTCPACRGARFNRQTLAVRYAGMNAADVLGLKISEAEERFRNVPRLHALLQTLCDVGLGYLELGQSSLTLSGGEAQRIKLAAELTQTSETPALILLDEPTRGLHPAEISRLIGLLDRLVERGHSVLVIEHQLDVIAAADWVIDMGPEGGTGGGEVTATGTPAAIAGSPQSHTGAALRARLADCGVEK